MIFYDKKFQIFTIICKFCCPISRFNSLTDVTIIVGKIKTILLVGKFWLELCSTSINFKQKGRRTDDQGED